MYLGVCNKMKYLVEKNTFEMARSDLKSVLNVAANSKEQKVLIESPNKNDINNLQDLMHLKNSAAENGEQAE